MWWIYPRGHHPVKRLASLTFSRAREKSAGSIETRIVFKLDDDDDDPSREIHLRSLDSISNLRYVCLHNLVFLFLLLAFESLKADSFFSRFALNLVSFTSCEIFKSLCDKIWKLCGIKWEFSFYVRARPMALKPYTHCEEQRVSSFPTPNHLLNFWRSRAKRQSAINLSRHSFIF